MIRLLHWELDGHSETVSIWLAILAWNLEPGVGCVARYF